MNSETHKRIVIVTKLITKVKMTWSYILNMSAVYRVSSKCTRSLNIMVDH